MSSPRGKSCGAAMARRGFLAGLGSGRLGAPRAAMGVVVRGMPRTGFGPAALSLRTEAALEERGEIDHLGLLRRALRLRLRLHLAVGLFLDHLQQVVAIGVVVL